MKKTHDSLSVKHWEKRPDTKWEVVTRMIEEKALDLSRKRCMKNS